MGFDEQFIGANLQYLTYQRAAPKNTMLEPEDLEQHCPLDNGLHKKQDIFSSIGAFNTLPVELLHTILLDVDLQTLTTLRSVNRRIRLTIDSLWQYNEIIMHAPHSLRATLSINVANVISCRQLHTELCSQECTSCGRFGAFLYLLTCSRVCFVCLAEDLQFLPVTQKHAQVLFRLDAIEIAQIPCALSIPGRYSQGSILQRRRIVLVDRTLSRLAGIRIHGSVEEMELRASQLRTEKMLIWEEKVLKIRAANARIKPPRPAYLEEPDDQQGLNPYRFMCVIRLPWLDRSKDEIEWGFRCSGCEDTFHELTDGKQDRRWIHTIGSYPVHVKQCRDSMEKLASLQQ